MLNLIILHIHMSNYMQIAHTYKYISTCVYIYIYIYTKRNKPKSRLCTATLSFVLTHSSGRLLFLKIPNTCFIFHMEHVLGIFKNNNLPDECISTKLRVAVHSLLFGLLRFVLRLCIFMH